MFYNLMLSLVAELKSIKKVTMWSMKHFESNIHLCIYTGIYNFQGKWHVLQFNVVSCCRIKSIKKGAFVVNKTL